MQAHVLKHDAVILQELVSFAVINEQCLKRKQQLQMVPGARPITRVKRGNVNSIKRTPKGFSSTQNALGLSFTAWHLCPILVTHSFNK